MLLYAPNWLFLLPGTALVLTGLFLVFWLLPGPRQISPHVGLDIHTMIFGVIFTLLGAQILSIGAFAKYSAMPSALTGARYLCDVF